MCCVQHAAGECVQFLPAGKLHWTWSVGHDGTTVLLLENTHCHLYFRGWLRGFNCLLRENASSNFRGSSVSACLLLSLFHALRFFGQDAVVIEYDLVVKVKSVFCSSQFLQLVQLDIVGFVHPSCDGVTNLSSVYFAFLQGVLYIPGKLRLESSLMGWPGQIVFGTPASLI